MVGVVLFFGYRLLFHKSTVQGLSEIQAEWTSTPTATSSATFVVPPTRTPTPSSTSTPWVIREVVTRVVEATPVVVVVTATPSSTPTPSPTPEPTSTPYVVYVVQTVECPTVVPAPTSTAVPAHSVVVCVHAQGIKGMYLDGVGLVDGGCRVLNIPIGVLDLVLHIER